MKRSMFVFCLMILIFSTFVYGKGFLIEVRASYFQPLEQDFKTIYGGGMTIGAELGITLWNWIGIWGAVDYLTKEGKTTFTEDITKLRIIPFYGGIKFQLPKSSVSPYVGFGFGYFQYKETNPIGEVENGDIGFIGRIGCIFKVTGTLFFDIDGSYSYCKVKPVDKEADLGGLMARIALGFEF